MSELDKFFQKINNLLKEEKLLKEERMKREGTEKVPRLKGN